MTKTLSIQDFFLTVGDYNHTESGFDATDTQGNRYIVPMGVYTKGQQDYKTFCKQNRKQFRYQDVDTKWFTVDTDGVRRIS